MIISLIAAIAHNNVIGNTNTLPWKLPADLKRFRILTTGKPIVMGRKTFESIGKPLPERRNVVISNDLHENIPGCTVVSSLQQALAVTKGAEEIMIIGGASIYAQFLPMAQRMYLTLIDEEFDGDVYFPRWNPKEWKEMERSEHEPDEKNSYRYTFLTLGRQ